MDRVRLTFEFHSWRLYVAIPPPTPFPQDQAPSPFSGALRAVCDVPMGLRLPGRFEERVVDQASADPAKPLEIGTLYWNEALEVIVGALVKTKNEQGWWRILYISARGLRCCRSMAEVAAPSKRGPSAFILASLIETELNLIYLLPLAQAS